ncbi:hypothetical protein [Paraburkholderia sp. GAS32]|uniref:hypothetical protein n=1 Tax=Paraburkholderia sp. GAS32 TaxID=3035129 RepID=UPI003D1BF534
MFKLKWPQFPSPYWFNGRYSEHRGIVAEDGTVPVYGSALELLDGVMPPAGTEVIITPQRFHLDAETAEEVTARKAREAAEREAYQAQQDREYRDRQDKWQREAEAANALLRIPVRWTSGLKTVLSGLSQNSMGTGTNRRSVAHILLLEPLDAGTLHRPANSFLCTAESGTNGKQWTAQLHTLSVGSKGPYVSQITCRQCLKLASRWKDSDSGVAPELIRG